MKIVSVVMSLLVVSMSFCQTTSLAENIENEAYSQSEDQINAGLRGQTVTPSDLHVEIIDRKTQEKFVGVCSDSSCQSLQISWVSEGT